MVPVQRPGSAVIFAVIGIVFAALAVLYGSVVHIGPDEVRRTIAGRCVGRLRREQIREVGVAGSNLFHRNNPNKTGTLYIYFSERSMTEDDRFEMMLNWPPKHGIYLTYDSQRMDFIAPLWDRPVETFNAGDITV